MDKLSIIAQEICACTRCGLSKSRRNAVPGEGPASAEIMLIGEGPGLHEDQQGKPFVGASGRFLASLLSSINYRREDVFITNIVKCRPPRNREPFPEEIQACANFLDRQIEVINPKVIVTLGRFAMARWFSGYRISDIHGNSKCIDGRVIVPLFHPAAALYQRSLRIIIEEDFRRLPEIVEFVRVKDQHVATNAHDSIVKQL